jgi:hypothetical protein
MKTFYLLTKTDKPDVIKKVNAESIKKALDIFCALKRLPKEDLLKIFLVTDKL